MVFVVLYLLLLFAIYVLVLIFIGLQLRTYYIFLTVLLYSRIDALNGETTVFWKPHNEDKNNNNNNDSNNNNKKKKTKKKERGWLNRVGRWVVGSASCVVRRASWVVGRARVLRLTCFNT